MYSLGIPNPKVNQNYSQGILKIFPRYSQDNLVMYYEVFPWYSQSQGIAKVFQRYSQIIPKVLGIVKSKGTKRFENPIAYSLADPLAQTLKIIQNTYLVLEYLEYAILAWHWV